MNRCPDDAILKGLLGESLDASERDSVARHVEGCGACQERLAHLTESAPWRSAEQARDASQSEEVMLRRLKQMAILAPTLRMPAAKMPSYAGIRQTAQFDCEWPDVPGYEILGELGRGGMGVVYQAWQHRLQRVVALKMILTGHRAVPKDLARFRAEAEAIARLKHPNIVQIHDVGDADGRPYFVLEYVSGGTLAHFLQGKPQPIASTAQLVETLARAVHAAHCNGVIHRDLKPANVLLHNEETRTDGPSPVIEDLQSAIPKIADFGLAKYVDGDSESARLRTPTVTGELLGTPNYMAPEQAMLKRPPIGPAVDIYALGAILYELLTGRPPFTGDTPLGTVLQVLHEEPITVTSLQPNVPRDLETICHKCLRKEPSKRYASALELADDLQRFLRDEPIQARPVRPMERFWRWVRRRPLSAGFLATGLLAPLVALTALWLLSAQLVRDNALDSAAQQAELLEEANNEYSRIVQRVEQAKYQVNKTVPPTPHTVPLSIPATFLHDVGEHLAQTSHTGVKVRQYSDFPFPWRKDGGPRDDFERLALKQLRDSNGQGFVHEFTQIDGQSVIRYAQARVMKRSCVECHNTHPQSRRKDWKEGDVRGVLVIIRPFGEDELRVCMALRLALLFSAIVSVVLLGGSLMLARCSRRRNQFGS